MSSPQQSSLTRSLGFRLTPSGKFHCVTENLSRSSDSRTMVSPLVFLCSCSLSKRTLVLALRRKVVHLRHSLATSLPFPAKKVPRKERRGSIMLRLDGGHMPSRGSGVLQDLRDASSASKQNPMLHNAAFQHRTDDDTLYIIAGAHSHVQVPLPVQVKRIDGSMCYLDTTSRKRMRARADFELPSQEQGALHHKRI